MCLQHSHRGLLHFSAIGFNDEAVLTNIDETVSWGFKKEKELNFKSIGAMDGWEGVWGGEKVELYQSLRKRGALKIKLCKLLI